MQILFIRVTRKFNHSSDDGLIGDERAYCSLTFVRRGGCVRVYRTSLKAAKKLLRRLKKKEWNVRPAITGWDVGWTAKPWSHIGSQKYMEDYAKALEEARNPHKEPRCEVARGLQEAA